MPETPDTLTLAACAKVNLDLRILGIRPDGFHDLRTVFQTLALHDVVTITLRPGPFEIVCTDPDVPVDRRNLVWRAAALLCSTARKGRGSALKDVLVHLEKRIPAQAGLGGGSADAAAALVGLATLWKLDRRSRRRSAGWPRASVRTSRSSWSAAPRSGSAAATTSIRSSTCRDRTWSWRAPASACRRWRPTAGTTRTAKPPPSAVRPPRAGALAGVGARVAQRPGAAGGSPAPDGRPHQGRAARCRGRGGGDVGQRVGGVWRVSGTIRRRSWRRAPCRDRGWQWPRRAPSPGPTTSDC